MSSMTEPLISIAEARRRVLAATSPLGSDRLPVVEALDRILAEDVTATVDVPPFASSAMDGYAVQPGAAGRELELAGESRAGAPAGRALGPGEAIRISTGAAVPDGAGAVIRQEDTHEHGGRVSLTAAVEAGQNIRPAGEVMGAGTTVLTRGTALRAPELAAAVTAGVGTVLVSRRPRAKVL